MLTVIYYLNKKAYISFLLLYVYGYRIHYQNSSSFHFSQFFDAMAMQAYTVEPLHVIGQT